MMGAEESGGFGFGMHLPERDGVYADLLLLDLFLREKAAGRWPVSQGDRALPRARRAVVLPADRRPRRAGRLPRDEAPPAGRPARAGAGRAGRRSRSPGPMPLDTERRLQVLPRRRLVAARSGRRAPSRSSASTPRRPRPRPRDALLAAGERLVRGRDATSRREPRARVDKPWGHELIWAHTDRYVGKILVIEAGKRLSLQRHEIKDESILVLSGRLRLFLEDDDGTVAGRGARAGRPPATSRPAGSTATRRSSGRELIEVSTPGARRRRPPRGRLRARGDQRPVGPSDGTISRVTRAVRGCTLRPTRPPSPVEVHDRTAAPRAPVRATEVARRCTAP